MTEQNPYEAPAVPSAPSMASMQPARPVSPKVFGIIGIIFSALGLFGSLMTLAMMNLESQRQIYEMMGISRAYRIGSLIIGFAAAMILLTGSIGLLRYRNSGRLTFNFYAVLAIVTGIIGSGYMAYKATSVVSGGDPAMIGGVVGGAIGGLIGLIFPVLGLIFLNRAAVRAALT